MGRWGRQEGWLPSLGTGGTPAADRSTGPVVRGDLDLDGAVDRDDVGRLVLGLRFPETYAASLGVPAALAGDTDGDGDLDFDDLAGFVALLESRDAPAEHLAAASLPGSKTFASAAALVKPATDAIFGQLLDLRRTTAGDTDGDGDVDFDDILHRRDSDRWTSAADALLARTLKWD